MVRDWNRLSTEVVDSSSLGVFKRQVDVAPGKWVSGGLGSAGQIVGLHFRVLFQPNQLHDSESPIRRAADFLFTDLIY